MTKKVEVAADDPGYAAYCDSCAHERGFVLPLEFAHGFLSVVQKTAIDMRADVHEQATGHKVLIVDYKAKN